MLVVFFVLVDVGITFIVTGTIAVLVVVAGLRLHGNQHDHAVVVFGVFATVTVYVLVVVASMASNVDIVSPSSGT